MLKSLDRLDHSNHTLNLKLLNPSSPATQLLSPSTINHSSPIINTLNNSKQTISPPIHASKPLRSKRPPSPPIRIPIEPGHCLVFGRKPDISSLSNEITPKSIMLPITLPKSFTHASRTHCLCTLIAPPLGGLNIRIVVKGQNGLMVDGERFEEGSSAGVELERRDGEQIELGFYGGKKVECYVKIDDHTIQRVRARPNAHGQSNGSNSGTTTTALDTTHPTSTRGGKRKLPGGANSTRSTVAASKLKQQQQQQKQSNHASSKLDLSSPTTNAPFESPAGSSKLSPRRLSSDLSAAPPPDRTISPPPAKKLCLSPIPSPLYDPHIHNLPAGDRVRSVMESMGLDLLGLIASAVVFSSRATVSTTELIRAVLDTQPTLAEAVLAVLPSPSSSRSSPRPSHRASDEFEIGLKKERECLSAPLPSPHPTHDDPSSDTKPFATSNDFKLPTHHRYTASEAGPTSSPALDFNSTSDLKTDRIVNACRPVILETLRSHWRADGSGMFGCVTNEGLKDASGEPLEALWYYQPQHDSDDERRLNLQPYVRHVRHTQTTSKQYFFKKVRGSGRRKS